MKDLDKLAMEIGVAIKNGEVDKAKELKGVYEKLKAEEKKRVEKELRDLEKRVLDRCIKKEDLEDGAWYDCDKEGKRFTRFGGIAQWDEKKQMFRAPGQQQFGMDGWLDHWEDVINTRYAGFPPMWKVEE
jgi:hypothetical protein